MKRNGYYYLIIPEGGVGTHNSTTSVPGNDSYFIFRGW